MAVYASAFNAVQDEYVVEVHYTEAPAAELAALDGSASANESFFPDIVAGAWLKSASTVKRFKSLDVEQLVDTGLFYKELLDLGRINGSQYLLPISFNLPAMVFEHNNEGLVSNPFTIGLEEIRSLALAYNTESNMGFSPVWNSDFLYIIANLYGASFSESNDEQSALAWNNDALNAASQYAQAWVEDNGLQTNDDFVFKYFYEPQVRLAATNRILFTYMDSGEFFTLQDAERANLGFRWVAGEGEIPIIEGICYLGICKYAHASKAAEAFAVWFFKEETQRQFLESAKQFRQMERSFGIAGGFSALRPVTEQIFPQYYPGLLGHMPPEDYLKPPNILPRNWMVLKEQVVIPWLLSSARNESALPFASFLASWQRSNR
jgi:hypothetical protein